MLEIKNVNKSFGGVVVLSNINLSLTENKIYALLGLNGAGKSTLVKIIMGYLKKDSGTVTINGEEIRSIGQALDYGIYLITQDLETMKNIEVKDFLFLGKMSFLLKERKKAKDFLKELNIIPEQKMSTLTKYQRMMIELIRSDIFKSKWIILDEPTSFLGQKETEQLFKELQKRKSKEGGIILITHKIDEVFSATDVAIVLRDGKLVGTAKVKKCSPQALIELMLGEEELRICKIKEATTGKNLLEVSNLNKKGSFYNISFNLKRGEVLGIVGLVGAGKTELAKSVSGYLKYDAGSIKVSGECVKVKNVRSGMREGIVYLTEERIMEGIFPQMSVMENMLISSFGGSITSVIRSNELKEKSMEWIKRLNIRCKDVEQRVLELSGGNQQKVLLARLMMMEKEIFIMDEPTKGIDIKTKEEIYALVRRLKEGRNGVIFISSDIDEVLRVCDRSLVISDGKIVAQYSSNTVKKSDILEVMFK